MEIKSSYCVYKQRNVSDEECNNCGINIDDCVKMESVLKIQDL